MSDAALIGTCVACLAVGAAAGWTLARRQAAALTRRQQAALDFALCDARTDALTGLPNRKAFDENLVKLAAISRRHKQPLALLVLDIDALKAINDRDGHAAGDELLRGFARMLTGAVRESDLPARVGGDEFAVLLPLTDLVGATVLAGRLLEHSRTQTGISASAGAAARQPDEPAEELLARADRALYHAKHAAPGRFSIHDGREAVSSPSASEKPGSPGDNP